MGFFNRVFNRGGEEEEEAAECSVCKRPAILTKRIKGLSPLDPPGAMLLNQVEFEGIPQEELDSMGPQLLHFCSECSENIAGYIVFLISEKEKEIKERQIADRLSELKVGTVLTMLEDSPSPLPNENVREMLAHTPFGSIFDISKYDN